jgi:hypothetical protein
LLEASLERNGAVHKVSLLPVENAVLAFFYEDTIKIGTLAVSTPGGKYLIAARALSERVAAIYHKMSIVSINTKLPEGEALRLYASLFDKARSGTGADSTSSRG